MQRRRRLFFLLLLKGGWKRRLRERVSLGEKRSKGDQHEKDLRLPFIPLSRRFPLVFFNHHQIKRELSDADKHKKLTRKSVRRPQEPRLDRVWSGRRRRRRRC